MEFLVRFESKPPESLSISEKDELRARERARAAELREAGTLVRLWRVPGTRGVVGLWNSADATALHDALSSLPTFSYMNGVSVEALATHPQEQK